MSCSSLCCLSLSSTLPHCLLLSLSVSLRLCLCLCISLSLSVSVSPSLSLSLYLSLSLSLSRRVEQSSPVHLGLAVSLCLLNLLFFSTGTLANMGGEGLCRWVGPALHYALLSSFTWMAMEVFYTFWMIYMLFRPSPKAHFWYLIGFGESHVCV